VFRLIPELRLALDQIDLLFPPSLGMKILRIDSLKAIGVRSADAVLHLPDDHRRQKNYQYRTGAELAASGSFHFLFSSF
jgi:hypothetical protein